MAIRFRPTFYRRRRRNSPLANAIAVGLMAVFAIIFGIIFLGASSPSIRKVAGWLLGIGIFLVLIDVLTIILATKRRKNVNNNQNNNGNNNNLPPQQ